MQIRTIIYHYIRIGNVRIQKHWHHQMPARKQSNRNSHSQLVGMQNSLSTLENSLMVSYKIRHTPTTQSSSQTLWYLCKGVENMSTQTCTQMFIAPLFTIAKIWKPPRCLSIDEWINKLWNNQTMEYYSALKNKPSVVHLQLL